MANERNERARDARVRSRLAALGWEPSVVDKVLRGPNFHSIKEIAGPETDGVALEAGADESLLLPHASGSGDDDSQPSVQELSRAVWYLLHGDPSRLLALSSAITELTGELQAYLIACLETAFSALEYLRDWRRDFAAQRQARDAMLTKQQTRREHIAVAVLESAALAEQQVPVVGADLRFALEVGIELREALLWSLPAPVILASKFAERVEGESGIYAGLEGPAEDIGADAVASRLRPQPEGTRYPFVPTLATFRREAARLLLYPHQANAIAPGSERYTWIAGLTKGGGQYAGAFTLSLQGSEMSLAELVLGTVDADESGMLLSGSFGVGDALGEIETGTLVAGGDAQRPPIAFIGVVRISDKRQWRADSVGEPDEAGRYKLLRFAPYEGDFEPPSSGSDEGGEDEEQDGRDYEDQEEQPESGQVSPPSVGGPDGSEQSTEPVTDDPDGAVVTVEIYGQLLGRKVPLVVVYKPETGLLAGAKVLIGDSSGDGYGYAGKPGRWKEVYGDKTPADFGLPSGYAVVIFDGRRAWPVQASYLAKLYGSNWKKVITGE